MKKYWKTITLCLLSIVVIGGAYIQTSLADGNTTVKFEQVTGDQKELDQLFLTANYGAGNQFKTLQFTNKETNILDGSGLIQEFTRINHGPLNYLLEDYKSFMRGKDVFGNYLFENDNYLIYANTTRAGSFEQDLVGQLVIEVLNKKTNKIHSTKLTVPDKKTYNWMDVVEVQLSGDTIKVFARGFQSDGTNRLNVYSVGLDDLKLIDDEEVVSTPMVKNGGADIVILNNYNAIQSERYLIYKIDIYSEDGKTEAEEAMNQVVIYDIETTQSKTVTLPEVETEYLPIDQAVIFESTLYIPYLAANNGLEIISYQVEKEDWGPKQSFTNHTTNHEAEFNYFKLMDGKVYHFNRAKNETDTLVFIGSLTTGETLYEGKLKVITTDDHNNNTLDVYDAELTK